MAYTNSEIIHLQGPFKANTPIYLGGQNVRKIGIIIPNYTNIPPGTFPNKKDLWKVKIDNKEKVIGITGILEYETDNVCVTSIEFMQDVPEETIVTYRNDFAKN